MRPNQISYGQGFIKPLSAELNPICHLLALLGAHHILHVSRIRVKEISTDSFSDERIVITRKSNRKKSNIIHRKR
jgi:transposase